MSHNMLLDRQIDVRGLVSCALWIAGFVLVFLDTAGYLADVGSLGVGLLLVGHLMTVQRHVRQEIDREMAAFELGREADRLRRVQ